MDQIVVGRLRAAGDPANGECNGDNTTVPRPSCLQRVLVTYKVGSILSGGTDNPPDNTGHGWAELYNTVQRYAIEHCAAAHPDPVRRGRRPRFRPPDGRDADAARDRSGRVLDPQLTRATGDADHRQLVAVGTT